MIFRQLPHSYLLVGILFSMFFVACEEHCEDLEWVSGNRVITDCYGESDRYFSMLVNGNCWSNYLWKIEENEDYFRLITLGEPALILTFPYNLIGTGPQPLFHTDEDMTQVPTIEMIDWRSECGHGGCTYSVICQPRDSKNQISIDETEYPVFMEIDLQVYLENLKEVTDSSVSDVLYISDSRIRIPVARVKEPKDVIDQCPDTSSAVMLFNGGCRTAQATHSVFQGQTGVRIESMPQRFLETLRFSVPEDFELGQEYEITSTSEQDQFEFDFSLTNGDSGYGGYDLYRPEENSRSFFVIDEISPDSTYFSGRVQGYFKLDESFSTFDTYEFIHIEECRFRSELLEF